MKFIFPFVSPVKQTEIKTKDEVTPVNEENTVYNLISEEPLVFDEIVEKTNFSIQKISEIILHLQIKELIRQLPGKQFIRSHHGRN